MCRAKKGVHTSAPLAGFVNRRRSGDGLPLALSDRSFVPHKCRRTADLRALAVQPCELRHQDSYLDFYSTSKSC